MQRDVPKAAPATAAMPWPHPRPCNPHRQFPYPRAGTNRCIPIATRCTRPPPTTRSTSAPPSARITRGARRVTSGSCSSRSTAAVPNNAEDTTVDEPRWCSRAWRARTRTCWRSTSSANTPAIAAIAPARATPAPAARDPVFTPRRASRRLVK